MREGGKCRRKRWRSFRASVNEGLAKSEYSMEMQRGFSLLELSIVLVIIGLLAGGIMVGQDMVRQAELRSLMTDVNKFKTALNTFKLKYSALPGDMRNATSYWGIAASGAACKTTQGTGTQTCDGDGDGMILTTATNTNEMFRFWQHLTNAGLIEGQYTGISGTATSYDNIVGTNCPASRINGVGFTPYYRGVVTADTITFDGDYDNALTIGSTTTGTFADVPFLTPAETQSIDKKMDDGLPGQGNIVAYKSVWNAGCTTTDVAATAAYSLSGTSKVCSFQLKKAF